MAEKDRRYHSVKALIDTGVITRFSEIFSYIPKSILARDLSINNSRMTKLKYEPGSFTFDKIKLLSDLLEVDYKQLVLLVADAVINIES